MLDKVKKATQCNYEVVLCERHFVFLPVTLFGNFSMAVILKAHISKVR